MNFTDLIYQLRTRVPARDGDAPHGMILMLHRVVEDACEYSHPSISQLHVTVRHLENLLVRLRADGYEVISLDQLYVRLKSGQRQSRFVVFTFDDAYRDSYELAFPVFKKHAAPFAVYVPTSVPDQEIFWWYYMLDDLVYRNDAVEVNFGGKRHSFVLGTVQEKRHAYATMEALINGIDVHSRREALHAIFEPHGLDPLCYARKLSMTWAQIRELDQSGLVTIGGHSVNHHDLTLISSEEALDEMRRGKSRIEEQTGGKVDHFCYPFGSAGYREFKLAAKLGFKTCTTCRHGYLTKAHRSYLERLPRIMVQETTGAHSLVG